MTRFTVTVQDGGLPEKLQRLALQFPAAVHRAYQLIGATWQRNVQDDIKGTPKTAPWERRPDGAPPQTRTGAYGRLLFFGTEGGKRTLASLRAILGTTARQGRIMELGGEIRPTKSKYLAIPLEAAYGGRRDPLPTDAFPDAFVTQSKGGNPLIAQEGADGDLEPLFLLRRSVRLKARSTLRKRAQEIARSDLSINLLRRAFRDVAGGAA